jgi:hypothetical protein
VPRHQLGKGRLLTTLRARNQLLVRIRRTAHVAFQRSRECTQHNKRRKMEKGLQSWKNAIPFRATTVRERLRLSFLYPQLNPGRTFLDASRPTA